MNELPRYRCIKVVQAAEIERIAFGQAGKPSVLHLKDHGAREARDGLFARYTPKPGDFYVVYDDGYESISPRKAFLEGYVPEGDDHPAVSDAMHSVASAAQDVLDAGAVLASEARAKLASIAARGRK